MIIVVDVDHSAGYFAGTTLRAMDGWPLAWYPDGAPSGNRHRREGPDLGPGYRRSLGPTTRFADERACDRLVELVIRRAAKRRIGARAVSTDQLAIPATASSSFTTW